MPSQPRHKCPARLPSYRHRQRAWCWTALASSFPCHPRRCSHRRISHATVRPVRANDTSTVSAPLGRELINGGFTQTKASVSGPGLKADFVHAHCHFAEVPCVDGSELARLFFTFAGWSVRPCVRPVCAVHMTAGHNALRGSGPGQNRAFDNALALVGCPDRRIDRLCITCCSLSQPSHHAGCRRDLVHAASATGSL
jgi:hypothetical protein